MSDDLALLRELEIEGLCCASILVRLGLFLRGEENEQFVSSVSGLCGGAHSGLLCGALTGAACMVSMFGDSPSDSAVMARELSEWFEAEYGEKYGGIDCRDITGEDPQLKCERCPRLIESVYFQAKTILEEYGKI
ncbi:MAG: C-GCAxxG-C-C family protein [Synergistaceae bacterium]|jgi:hypothetical protein|nr:C-GCAxxG-C-C family protein [Synergistaceae bacterium]